MEEAIVVNNNNKGEEGLDLPPGFRFHPTDEEVISYYLTEKVLNRSFSATAMGEADLNKCEPWDLPKRAKMGEKEWYFFCQRDRKYPTGMRTNRATESGYWKATGKDKEIYKGKRNLVGMKKTLVFYRGRAPKGEKTNWVMHEFRLEGKFPFPHPAKEEWVVCKIFHKNTSTTAPAIIADNYNNFNNNMNKRTQFIPPAELVAMGMGDDDLLECSSLPPLMDPQYPPHHFTNKHDEFKDASYASNYNQIQMIPNSYTTTTPLIPQNMGIQNPSYRMTNPRAFISGRNHNNMSSLEAWMMDNKQSQCSNREPMSSNHSGLSNDRTGETSSAVSNSTAAQLYHQDFKPPSLGALADLDCLWDI